MNDNEDAHLEALPVIDGKFWIVERQGKKVATIQTTDDGVVWVDGARREKFATIRMLKDRHKVEFLGERERELNDPMQVHGYPTDVMPHNALYDVTRHLPIYTQEENSKSYYCAGHYLVLVGHAWVRHFCPKLITLQRYQFQGPFRTEEEQSQRMRETNG